MIEKITAVIAAVSFKHFKRPSIVNSRYIIKPIMTAQSPAIAADSEGVSKPA